MPVFVRGDAFLGERDVILVEHGAAGSQATFGGIAATEAADESGDHGVESWRCWQPGQPHPELSPELLELGEAPAAWQVRARSNSPSALPLTLALSLFLSFSLSLSLSLSFSLSFPWVVLLSVWHDLEGGEFGEIVSLHASVQGLRWTSKVGSFTALLIGPPASEKPV